MLLEKFLENINSFDTVLIDDKKNLTHTLLTVNIEKIIRVLSKEKFDPNICIGLRFYNQRLQLLFTLALFKMGIKQVSLNPFDMVEIQEKTIEKTQVDLVIQESILKNNLIDQTLAINNKLQLSKYYNGLNITNKLSKDTALVFLSSGTTGEPKVIELSLKVYEKQLLNDMEVCQFQKGEIFYCVSKIYYQFSLRRSLVALLKGASIILPQKKPINIIKYCLENNVKHLQLTGDQALKIIGNLPLKVDSLLLSELKSCVVSSSIISEYIRKEILNKITKNLYISYGTNEFGNISEAYPNDFLKREGTVGKINKNVELKLFDDNGIESKEGEAGHIAVKTSSMIKQYYNNSQATINSFKNGWYFPGDMGRLIDKKELVVEGRSDDMMIYNGVNIYPRELESVLELHPMVVEAAVFPLKRKMKEGIPYAVVVLKEKVSDIELLEYCKSKVGWKAPIGISIIDKLPRSPQGKVLKQALIRVVKGVLQDQSPE